MRSLLARSIGGLAAGAAGTIAMGGMSFFLRRMIEPTASISKTHYEKVVEWGLERAGSTTEMDDPTRIRRGELLHLGFGAFWGVVFVLLNRNRRVRPLSDGALYGTALWVGAFGGYIPALGISRSLRQMKPYELLRTLACHLTYAVTTVTFVKAFRKTLASIRS